MSERKSHKSTRRVVRRRTQTRAPQQFGVPPVNPMVTQWLRAYSNPSTPFPAKMRARLCCEMFSYTSSGAGTGTLNLSIALNSAFQPFNTGILSGLTPVWRSFSTAAPIGYSTLANANVYTNVRVLKSTLFVNVIPDSVTDSVFVIITPSSNHNPTNSAISNSRMAASAVLSTGRPPPTEFGVVNSVSIARWYGVPERAVREDLSGEFSHPYNNVPLTPLYWGIAVNTSDNSTFGSPVGVDFRLLLDVEFYALSNSSLPQT